MPETDPNPQLVSIDDLLTQLIERISEVGFELRQELNFELHHDNVEDAQETGRILAHTYVTQSLIENAQIEWRKT